jgi:hypothetical protein
MPRRGAVPMTLAWRCRALLAAAAAGVAVAAAGHAAAVLSWPGPPRTSPPQVAGVKTVPPPAWVETPQHSSWLGYSSYCWSRPAGTAACVDFLLPRSRTDLPLISAHAGSELRFHLRFAISKLSVAYLDKSTERLKATRVASWLPVRSGIVTLSARSTSGQEADYLFRLTLAPPTSQEQQPRGRLSGDDGCAHRGAHDRPAPDMWPSAFAICTCCTHTAAFATRISLAASGARPHP